MTSDANCPTASTIAAATARLKEFSGRFAIFKSNYKDYETVFAEAGIDKIDGALLDFGISSHPAEQGNIVDAHISLF